MIISICMGLRQSLGLFMRPMTLELGISAAAFGFSIALQNIVWGVSQPFVGAIADRYGARPVLIVTRADLRRRAAADDLFAQRSRRAARSPASCIGIGTAGTGFGVLIGTVSRATPPEKRSQTVGMVAAGGLARHVRDRAVRPVADRRASAGRRAMLALRRCSRPRWCCCRCRSAKRPHATKCRNEADLGEAVREALGHRGYLFMTLAFFACGFQLVFITTHLPAYLQLCGVAPGVGATALGADRPVQRHRHLHLRPARRALQPEAPARAHLPAAHRDHRACSCSCR